MGKIKIYIDGENLLHTVAHVLIEEKLISNKRQLKSFPVRTFLGLFLDVKDVEIIYYGTKLKVVKKPAALRKKSEEIITQNRSIVAALYAEEVRYVRAGNLVVRDSLRCKKCGHKEAIFREKGVDVRMAVNLIQDALQKRADECVVVSSDSDLLPALQLARQTSTVTYVGFSESLNIEMAAAAQRTVTFTRETVVEAFNRVHKK